MIVRINNTELEYFIDFITKKMHLLDLDNSGTKTLTNAIDPHFQQALIDQENLLQDIIDFEWLVYATDGIIASYSDYNFKFVNPKLPYLHKPYVDVMKKRRPDRFV